MLTRRLTLVVLLGFAVSARAQEQKAPAPKSLTIRVIHSETGQPVPGVLLAAQIGQPPPQKVETDAEGNATFSIPPDTKSFTVWYEKKGFRRCYLAFGDDPRSYAINPIPETHNLRLYPGVTVGGIVRDDRGAPVEGARVSLTFETDDPEIPTRNAMRYGDAQTDAEGRWEFAGAPTRYRRLMLHASHPDYVLQSFSHNFGPGQAEELTNKALAVTIKAGVMVEGVVVDPEGKPVADAEVTASEYFGVISNTTTDADGKFKLRGVEPGSRRIAAKSKAFALGMVTVMAEAGTKPVELRLSRGRAVRVVVVDDAGQPVANAYVSANSTSSGGERQLQIGNVGETDDTGELAWGGAPAEQLTLTAYSNAYSHMTPVPLAADQNDIRLVLRRPVVLQGQVVDDQSGQPIPQFRIRITMNETAPVSGARVGSAYTYRDGVAGKYNTPIDTEAASYVLRIEAPGYEAAESPALPRAGSPLTFDARLKKSASMTGLVLLPDGSPAAGAEVGLMEESAAIVESGVLSGFFRQNSVVVTADAQGNYTLPQRPGLMSILALHPQGYADFTRTVGDDQATPSKATMTPWCEIEGVLLKAGKPWAGQKVVLDPASLYTRAEVDAKRRHPQFRYEATTHSNGRFMFRRVRDGKAAISVQQIDRRSDGSTVFPRSQTINLTVSPGEKRRDVRIGGMGRPVVGTVSTPENLRAQGLLPTNVELAPVRPEFTQPENWNELGGDEKARLRAAYEQSPEYQRYERRTQRIVGTIAADGSFRVDDVPAGDYTLQVYIHTRSRERPNYARAAASASVPVDVPDMPGGLSDEPLEAGIVTLRPHGEYGVGDPVPDFDVPTYDARRLRLADYRGSYVLIDFWATWCGPCIVEMKTLQRIQDEFGNDPRFVMISLSIDDRIEAPTRFVAARRPAGLQGYAGRASGATARQDFGVSGIPSIWLIAPDGKIIAKEIYGEQVVEAVRSALSKAP